MPPHRCGAASQPPSRRGQQRAAKLAATTARAAPEPAPEDPCVGQAASALVAHSSTQASSSATPSASAGSTRPLEGNADGVSEPAALRPRKGCRFLCAAVCFETPDPVNCARKSIRWAYDVASSLESTGLGGHDWYCGRAWCEHAATGGVGRDRGVFQQECARDKDKLNAFLKVRQKVIEKHAKRAANPKRSGGYMLFISMLSTSSTLAL